MPFFFGFELKSRMLRPAVVLAMSYLALASNARAEGVTIESDNPRQSIRLKLDNATIRSVLQAVHDKYGIEVSAGDDPAFDDPVTATYEGNLPKILERMLRNQNYMLVRSAKNVTGVEKILITVVDRSKPMKPTPAPEPTPMP